MPGWTEVPGSTHQAALAGKVIDALTRLPVSGVTVSITAMPPTFSRWLSARALQHGASWERLSLRPDRVRTAEDGGFCFVDLPDGAYTLSFALAHAGHRYGPVQRALSVTRNAQGLVQGPLHEVPLPPTGARGQIKGLVQGTATVLPLARVRVKDSGEQAYADAEGRFFLTGVEPGTRTLVISASGFQPTTAQAVITEGSITALTTLVLNPTS